LATAANLTLASTAGGHLTAYATPERFRDVA
jgi:hypothetical protein